MFNKDLSRLVADLTSQTNRRSQDVWNGPSKSSGAVRGYEILGSDIIVPESVGALTGEKNILGHSDGRKVTLIFSDVALGEGPHITKLFQQKVGGLAMPVIQRGGMYNNKFSIEMSCDVFFDTFER